MSNAYDLLVIGSGPGGYAAALTGARQGLRTGLIDRGAWGGVCLNVGCIPTKALIAVGHAMRTIRRAGDYGIRVEGARIDYAAVRARNERIITMLRTGLVGLLRQADVELIAGEAALDGPAAVRLRVDGAARTLTAQRLVIATGAAPHPGPWAFDGTRIVSYRDLLALPELPRSLLIIGGGVIGCEFASCFANFGVPVTLIEQQPQLLPNEDPEAVRFLTQRLQAVGVTVMTGVAVQRLGTSAAGVDAVVASGGAVSAERCLVAVGIRPNSRGLGLEALGIKTDGGIEVNEHLLTAQPHIAAIGDCLPGHGLAHWASAEGVAAVRNLTQRERTTVDPRVVPRCVYTDPEFAHVGLTESQAAADCRVSRFSFAALGKSVCDETAEGFVKLLVEGSTDRVVGATIVGAQASTLIHLAVLAIQQRLTAAQLARTITAHPTLSEAVTEAAAQVYGEALSTNAAARAPRGVRASSISFSKES